MKGFASQMSWILHCARAVYRGIYIYIYIYMCGYTGVYRKYGVEGLSNLGR